jgi:hypothetical protein
MNRNSVGSNCERSSMKIAHFIPIRWQTWSPQKILVSDWPKLTKAVVLNSFAHGRLWQFACKENVRCTRLMQRSLQVVMRPEWLNSLSTSIKLKYCVIKRISHYSINAPGQLLKVSVAYWAPTVMSVPQKALKKIKCSRQ